MITRKPYYKPKQRSQPYFNFMFETEQEATMFRETCELLGMRTDKTGYANKYKTVVYILDVEAKDDKTND